MVRQDSARARARSRSRGRVSIGLALPALLVGLLVAPAARAAAPVFASPFALARDAEADDGSESTPVLAGDGAGRWVAVWSSDDPALGPDLDLLVARSGDGGLTWSDPEPLDAGAFADAAEDAEPALATDGAGTWVVVWSSDDSRGGAVGNDFDLLFARSQDDGATWSRPEPLNGNADLDAGRDSQPRLVTDGSGTWIAVWTSRDTLGGTIGADDDILFTRSIDAGLSWSPPAPLHPHAAAELSTDSNPSLAADGAGGWLVAWQSRDSLGWTIGTDYDVLAVRSADGGLTWSAPEPVHDNAATEWGADILPAVCADGLGGWLVAWESRETLGGEIGSDSDVLIAWAAPGSGLWNGPAPLHGDARGDTKQDGMPALVADGHGHVLAAWASNGPAAMLGADLDVVFAFSEDGGATWTEAAPVHANAHADSGVDTAPSLATDGTGRWLAAWHSNDSFGGTLGTDFDPLAAIGVQPAVCGDGRLHPDEDCDGGPGCRDDCTLAFCGDGIPDPDETCDDGNLELGDGCRPDCSVERCGDAILDSGETCDDGNALPGDGCDASCQVETPAPTTVADLLTAFDAAVAEGTLHGAGHGRSASQRLRALRTMLARAAAPAGRVCGPLSAFAQRVDGGPRPRDFAAGEASTLLASEAARMLAEHGCRTSRPERGRRSRR